MMRVRRARAGFTLLEMILATGIGVLLMLALYAVLDSQIRHVEAGREVVEQSTLARAVLSRVANDITCNLGPVPPVASSPSSSSSSSGTSGQSSTSTSGTVNTTAAQFNLGVQGETDRLVLFVSRVPSELYANTGTDPGVVADLRRITYWLATGNGTAAGLARQEVKLVTSDDAAAPPDAATEAASIIADEVRSVEFRYFDGMNWQDFWDGTSTANDGKNPVGPPLAIEIRIGVVPVGRREPVSATDGADQNLKYYRHVVAINAANGILVPQQ